MSAYTYGLKSPLQRLERARTELGKLLKLQDELLPPNRGDEPASLAMKLGTDIWHITDAVVLSEDADLIAWRATKKVKDVKAFQAQIEKQYPNIGYCRELANGAKHHLAKQPLYQVEEAIVSVMPSNASAISVVVGHTTYRPKITINGKKMLATDLFSAAIAQWDKFFKSNGLKK